MSLFRGFVGSIIGFLCGITEINPYELGYLQACKDIGKWAKSKQDTLRKLR